MVLGGPLATLLDAELLEKSTADPVVRGEGEGTVLDAADAVESGGALGFHGVT